MRLRHVAARTPFSLATFAVAVILLRCASGLETSGVLPAFASHFAVYVGKFCFDFNPAGEQAGLFEFEVVGDVSQGLASSVPATEGPPCWGPCETQGNMYLMVFDDEPDHWAVARSRWDIMTCEERLKSANYYTQLTPLGGRLNRTVEIREKIRPRFWYFTFVSCGASPLAPVEYRIHATNTRQGFDSEFSYDQAGILSMQFFFALCFSGLAAVAFNVTRRGAGTEALRSRPLLCLVFLSAICSAAGAWFLTLHFFTFALYGEGLGLLRVLGVCLGCGGKALLSVLQLLAAKGWALFYAPEELSQRRMMTCALGSIISISAWCEIHGEFFHDWSATLYLYESGPGIAILALNAVLFLEAWRSMHETYRHETSQEVRVFYFLVTSACCLYFLALPLICILASALSPWVRDYYVTRVEITARFLATVILAICLRPSRLDAMISARLEDGLEPIGEMREDSDEKEERQWERDQETGIKADARREDPRGEEKEMEQRMLDPSDEAEPAE